MEFIDAHTHIVPVKFFSESLLKSISSLLRIDPEFYGNISRDPKNLIKYMDEKSIKALVIMSYPAPDVMGFGDEQVDEVAQYVKDYRDRLLQFGSVHPRLNSNPLSRLEEMYSKYEIRGLKLHTVHQLVKPNAYRPDEGNLKSLEQIYQFASDYNLPMLIHTGTSMFPRARNKYGDPIFLDELPLDFPKMRIILSHGGRPIWMETAFFLLRRHRQIIFDISSIPPSRLLDYFPRFEMVSDRAIFGSDWPGPGVRSIHENIQEFLKLPLSEEVKRKVIYENAAKLFNIK
ncbi:MAG: amidohydrolase family protein [Candidatus Jordarchaeaceae archaeon]